MGKWIPLSENCLIYDCSNSSLYSLFEIDMAEITVETKLIPNRHCADRFNGEWVMESELWSRAYYWIKTFSRDMASIFRSAGPNQARRTVKMHDMKFGSSLVPLG